MKTKLKIVITLVVVFIASKPFSGCIKESQLANIHDISPSDAQELITAANIQFERHIEGLIPVQQILQHNSRSKHATINFYFKYNDKAEVSLAAIREQEMIDLARFTPVKLQVSEMEGVLLFQKKFASKSIAF